MKRTAVLAALVLALADRNAAGSGFAALAPGARLAPRDSALASFELPRELSGIKEMEFVLSLDGGETFPLRLTSEIDPGTRRVGWRVPALPTARAVLALRVGDEDGEERIVFVSGVFAITADPGAPLDDIGFAHGEWRTREAGFDGTFPFRDASLSGEERVHLSPATPGNAFVVPRSLHPGLSSHTRRGRSAIAAASSLCLLPLQVPRIPVLLPRRE